MEMCRQFLKPLRRSALVLRPGFPASPAGVYTILIICLCCLCSLFTLCSGSDCTPVYEGPRIEYDEVTLKLNTSAETVDSGGVFNASSANSVMVFEGTSFNLTCTLSQHYIMKWRLRNEDIPSDNTFLVSVPIKQSGLISSQLTATNVTRNHSGEYTCVAAGCPSGTSAGLRLRVIYADRPIIDFQFTQPRKPPSDADLNNTRFIVPGVLGMPANMSCTVRVVPVLKAKWRKKVMVGNEPKWQEMEKICEEKHDAEAVTAEKKWLRKESEYEKDEKPPKCLILNVRLEDGSLNMTLFFVKLAESDLGDYSCGVTNDPLNPKHSKTDRLVSLEATSGVRVKREKPQTILRDPPITYTHKNGTTINIIATRKFKGGSHSMTVIEGDAALVYCNLSWPGPDKSYGYSIHWFKDDVEFFPDKSRNQSMDTNSADITSISIGNSELIDRGIYRCVIVDSKQFKVSSFQYLLRVRNKMAARWPFIAIIVEVIVICLIILIYEKTKSKAETADSDTDGSPDQKNVSDTDGASEVVRLQQKE